MLNFYINNPFEQNQNLDFEKRVLKNNLIKFFLTKKPFFAIECLLKLICATKQFAKIEYM